MADMTPIERKARELLIAAHKAHPNYTPRKPGDKTVELHCMLVEMIESGKYVDSVAIDALITALTPPAGGLPELPELFEVLDYATPGPWRWSVNGNIVPEQYGDDSEIAAVYSEHMDDAQAPDNAAAIIASVNWLRANRDALEAIAASRVGELESLRAIAACAYQLAGYHDAPEIWLDRLSEAANGDPLPSADAIIDELLPYAPAAAPQVALNRGG